jgi:NAD(P)-dependent dehydrogenase (short-subunit alcohol dehydrogenase family)
LQPPEKCDDQVIYSPVAAAGVAFRAETYDLLTCVNGEVKPMQSSTRGSVLDLFRLANAVAVVVVFLAGPASSYVTGVTLAIDGGTSGH